MRYVIDAEYRVKAAARAPALTFPFASALRLELSQRSTRWALDYGYPHEMSLGAVPAVLYREDEAGRHGNFLDVTYRRIRDTPAWAHRFDKVHTSAKRVLLSRAPGHRELDSSNSSDALLMNLFCHPDTLKASSVHRLLAIDADVEIAFGYRPGIPLSNGRKDCTEVDLRLGNLLIEAKLTEYDFQTAPIKLITRYRNVGDVFDIDQLDLRNGLVCSYQLIRGVLAAYATPDGRFCVLCDARRPDLVDAWHRVMMAVKPYDLRCRLQILTWQELAAALPQTLRLFLESKYGVTTI